jgi:hypothetical protein
MPHLALFFLVLQCHMSSAALSNVVCYWESIWLSCHAVNNFEVS